MERAAGRRTEGVDPAEHVRQWQVGQVGADGLQPRHELLAVRGEQRVVRRQQVNVLHQRRPVPANRPARSRTALSRLGDKSQGWGTGAYLEWLQRQRLRAQSIPRCGRSLPQPTRQLPSEWSGKVHLAHAHVPGQ